ncbi:MAG: alpha-galactosidase [Candidatus Lokiarchaeota archaeon]|nr:alpha-galactosidase [Candidatus Lokiarchaeota archaeon]
MIGFHVSEDEYFINFKNGIIRLEFDLRHGKFSIYNEKYNYLFIKNAVSMIKFKIKTSNIEDLGESIISCKSSDNYQRTWEIKESSEIKGNKGSVLIVNNQNNKNLPDFEIYFILFQNLSDLFIQINLYNTLRNNIKVISFHPLHIDDDESSLNLGSNIDSWRIFKTDWQSWSIAKVMSPYDSDKLPRPKLAKIELHSNRNEDLKNGLISCENFVNINENSLNTNFLCGFVSLKNQLAQILLKFDKSKKMMKFLSARSQADEVILSKGNFMNSEKLAIYFTKNENSLENLKQYFDAVEIFNDAIIWEKVPKGWCSWYHYYNKITEVECLKNLEFLEHYKDKIPIDFFQIDDGFQIRAGEWIVNEKFPNGMKFLVNKIKEKGFIPGLWLAPFLVSTKSSLIKDHPTWFLKNSKGKYIVAHMEGFENVKNRIFSTLKSSCYALDCTHPEVQEWIRKLFIKVCKEWGYKYIKIDFIYAAAIEGEHYDKRYTRAQAYRKGLEVIREAVGDDIFILGCGAPLGPAIGMVNGMRVSMDTAPTWDTFLRKLAKKVLRLGVVPTVYSAMHNNILASFYHKKLWLNDPDCVMIRNQNTKLSDIEVQTQISLIGLCNGMFMLSDDFSKVSQERIELIKKFIPLDENLSTALPMDLFESDLETPPTIYALDIKTQVEWKVVGVMNWSNYEITRNLGLNKLGLDPNKQYHAYEFWNQEYLGRFSDSILLKVIEKHGCKLLKIKEVKNHLDLISTTFHFTQGAELKNAYYDKKTDSFNIETSLIGFNKGSMVFYSPNKINFIKIETNASNNSYDLLDVNLFKVNVEFRDDLKLKVIVSS